MNQLYWPSTAPGRLVAIIVYGCAVAAALGLAGVLAGIAKAHLILPFTAAVSRAFGDTGIHVLAALFLLSMVGLLVYGRSTRSGA